MASRVVHMLLSIGDAAGIKQLSAAVYHPIVRAPLPIDTTLLRPGLRLAVASPAEPIQSPCCARLPNKTARREGNWASSFTPPISTTACAEKKPTRIWHSCARSPQASIFLSTKHASTPSPKQIQIQPPASPPNPLKKQRVASLRVV